MQDQGQRLLCEAALHGFFMIFYSVTLTLGDPGGIVLTVRLRIDGKHGCLVIR